MTTNQITTQVTEGPTRTEQDAAFTAVAERLIDFAEAGIERFGSPEAFLAALNTYNATR